MKKPLFYVLAMLALLAVAAAPRCAIADSLWTPESGSLFADHKARRAGDILTVLVSEQTQAVAQATTKGGSTDLNASGQTARNGSLTGRITVTVKSVDASGNLLVEGVREVTINAEKQKMIFSGRVRAADVQPDNTVASAQVAEATITYEGKGPVGNKQREGIITRIFRILF